MKYGLIASLFIANDLMSDEQGPPNNRVRMFDPVRFFEHWNVRCSNVRRYPNVRKFECSDVR